MGVTISEASVHDVRFPTSRELDGSDAMNPAPDYSMAYVVLHTSAGPGLEGHGFTFTIGRGNDLCCHAIRALTPLLVGRSLDEVVSDLGGMWRTLTGDSQLRWLGPEKGVIHLAAAAVVNAVWDLYAKYEDKPLWKLLVDMPSEQLVSCIDFRHLTDVLTPDDAVEFLRSRAAGADRRERHLREVGYPAYTTSVGWLGYGDDKIRALSDQAVQAGWSHLKMKVGRDLDDDLRRAAIIRSAIGPDRHLMMDANQVWDVPAAIEWTRRLAVHDPWWIEEPTSPDDVLGHATIARAVAPIRVATGEHAPNRVVFKQLLQSDAIGVCQPDVCRLGGVNEMLAVLLLAARFDVPVCPHAGGVGLSEYVQHVSMFDYVRVSASLDDRVIEYVDHLHEHFVDPVRIRRGRYQAPARPGFSAQLRADALRDHRFPDGAAWRA